MYRFLCWVGLVWSVAYQLGAQGFVWTRQIGNNASPFGDKVAVDSSSNVYIAGAFTGTASFGSSNVTSAGKNDAFLAKYDSSGNLSWVKQAGGAQEDVAGDVAVDTNGNVYVVGGFSGTATFDTTNLTAGESVFIAKYNSSGTLIWVRQTAGVGGGRGLSVAVDNVGNVYWTGYFKNSSGWYSIVVDKWSSSGNLVWHQEVAGSANSYGLLAGNSLKVDAGGNVYVTGTYSSQVTMGTNVFAVFGGNDAFIAKLDRNGNFVWAKIPDSSNPPGAAGNGVALDGFGNVLIVGNFTGPIAFGTNQLSTANGFPSGFLVKCDTNGEFFWARQTVGNGSSLYGVTAESGGVGFLSWWD